MVLLLHLYFVMKMPDAFPGSSHVAPLSLVRELILRQHFLVLALDRADDDAGTGSQNDCSSLISDLNESVDYLRSISDKDPIPAFGFVTNKEANDWEKELFVAFSLETPRWDRVLRLNHELDRILDLFSRAGESRPDFRDEFERRHVLFQAHKDLQASILHNWIVAEQNRGQPIGKVIEMSEAEWRDDWTDVLKALGEREIGPGEPAPLRALHSAMDKILHPFAPKSVNGAA